MLRKLLVTVIVAVAVFAAGSIVYAQSDAGNTRYVRNNKPVFELISDINEKNVRASEYIVEANTWEGTEVIMDLYWFMAEDEKSIIARKKPSRSSEEEGIWVLQSSEQFIVGSSGIFAGPVSLSPGKNKIVLYIKDINGNKDKKTLELVYSLEKQVLEEVNGSSYNKYVDTMSNALNSSNREAEGKE